MSTADIVALTAAIVAAALAAAKVVADKESKVSDFRAGWINSFRGALAECLAEAHVISGRIRIRAQHSQGEEVLLGELDAELTNHWLLYRKAYRMALLHLNFAETSVAIM